MATDVGGVKFDIDVTGGQKSEKIIDSVTTALEEFDQKLVRGKQSQEKNQQATTAMLNNMRKIGPGFRKALLGVNDLSSGLKRFRRIQQDVAKEAAANMKKAASPKFNMDKIHGRALEDNKKRLVAFNKVHGQALELNKKRTASLRKLAERQKKTTQSTRKLGRAMRSNSNIGTSWLKRFTLIAGGFALAHLALRAFGDTVRLLTSTFARGATIADSYAEGLATIAGMVAITHEGMGGFIQRFEGVRKVMKKTMQESVRLAPTFRLSMEEITESYRELAQFGVIVKKPMVEATMATLSAMKEIAATTGSTTRQMRQEIQAMFSGQARATDQFARTIKRTMPEVWKQLIDPAKDATDKWKVVTAAWSDFAHAAIVASRTLRGQFEKLKIGISLISEQALTGSGIYQLWVDKLVGLNEKLFMSGGELTEFGKKVRSAFDDIWNAANNAINLMVGAVKGAMELWTLLGTINPKIQDMAKSLGTFAFKAFLVTTALSLIAATLKTIAAATGAVTVFRALKGVFTAAFAATLGTIVTGFTALVSPVIAAAAALGLALVAGKAFAWIGAFALDIWTQVANSNVWNAIVKNVKLVGSMAKIIMTNLFNPKEAMRQLAELSKGLRQSIIRGLDFEHAKQAGDKAGDLYVEGLMGAKDAVVDGFIALKDDLVDLMSFDLFPEGTLTKGKETLTKFQDLWNKMRTGFREATRPEEGEEGDEDLVLTRGAKMLEGAKEFVGLMEKLADNLKSTWADIFNGKLVGLTALWDSIMKNMVKTFADAMTDMTTYYVKTFLMEIAKASQGTIFGTIGNAVGKALTVPGAPAEKKLFTGGLITEPVHGIGAQSGRPYSFGEQGTERVLSASQTRQSVGGGGAPVINITNNSSRQIKQSQNAPRFDGKKMIIDVLLEDYVNGGRSFQALGGR